MKTADELVATVRQMDGRPYGVYKRLIGEWDYKDFVLHIDRVQSDPFAPPSSCRIVAPLSLLGLDVELTSRADLRIPLTDFIARRALNVFRDFGRSSKDRPTLWIAPVGQEILERSSVVLGDGKLEMRLQLPFPARGRSILGKMFADFLDYDLYNLVCDTLDFQDENGPREEDLRAQIASWEDWNALQAYLEREKLVAFIAEGSILPRSSGVSNYPLRDAVPFSLPKIWERESSGSRLSPWVREVQLPHAGTVRGLAIGRGITVIAGGGYHGKSTLLHALEHAVYPHVPGDGRELVACLPQALKVRAEDGRSITGTDISLFISELPGGRGTSAFRTTNASGSTSQAASIAEAIEAKCPLLLIDEDTSATNLLIRDELMGELVATEPITPLSQRVRALHRDLGISLVMVMGGSGQYLAKADQVLLLDSYITWDATEAAREICAARGESAAEALEAPLRVSERRFLPCLPPSLNGKEKTRSKGRTAITLNREEIDISALTQIVDPGQALAIAYLVRFAASQSERSGTTLAQLFERFEDEWACLGWSAYHAGRYPAFLVRPRAIDWSCALGRYRRLRVLGEVCSVDPGEETDAEDFAFPGDDEDGVGEIVDLELKYEESR